MGRDKGQKRKGEGPRGTLFEDMEADRLPKPERNRVKPKKAAREEKEEREADVLPKSLGKRLLRAVRAQQEEEEEDMRDSAPAAKQTSAFEANDEDDVLESDEEDLEPGHGEDVTGEGEEEISPEDEKLLAMFMGPQSNKAQNLGDIILQKIKEKEKAIGTESADPQEAIRARLNPKVVEVYTQIADILSKYTSGPLPKAFKIIPGLSNWEEILYLTKPETWSPAAVRMATKIFASNLSSKLAQKFYNTVLLPRVRDNIATYKKLNWHLYMALKKALFKASAFYKGFLLPLCSMGDCTLREATIVGSLLKKVSIPQVQSSVALLKIAEMPYSGANSIFIRILIDKKYALPHPVIDALVNHFLSFRNDSRQLPVLWHHALLAFAQRYKKDIREDQKKELKSLLNYKNHHLITPEIKRELFSSVSREGAMHVDQDNEVMHY